MIEESKCKTQPFGAKYRQEAATMNFEAIKSAAKGYEADMTRFLRDLIAIPSESCGEEGVIKPHRRRDGEGRL
jgi:hypothetical protein